MRGFALFGMFGPYFIFYVITLPISLVLHEYAHARTADWLGDKTARLSGRLTLNPIVHLDPIGLLMMLFGPIGWAKPIPVTASNFKHPRRGIVLTATAGPLMNLAIALIAVLIWKLLNPADPFSAGFPKFWYTLLVWFIQINVYLFVFNLIPIPPLDGSRIVGGLLPYRAAVKYSRLELYGPFILLLLVIIQPLRNHLLYPLFNDTLKLFGSLFGFSVL